ncbi:MAG: hypothetical protein RLZZ371_1447 [Pseudomonadota bacterium]
MNQADTLFPKKGEESLSPGVHRTVSTGLDKAHAPPPAFSWPTPPFASYEAQQLWRDPQECELEGLNGAIRRCLLITMDVVNKVAVIQIARNKAPVSLPFSQFSRLHLKKLLHPQEIQTTEQFAELLGHRATVEYRLQLSPATQKRAAAFRFDHRLCGHRLWPLPVSTGRRQGVD